MALDTFRIKHFLAELRYPSNFNIPRRLWDVPEKFPTEKVGMNEFGLIGQMVADGADYAVEMQRAHYNIENITEFDSTCRKSSEFFNFVLSSFDISQIARLGLRFYVMALDQEAHDQAFYAGLLSKQIQPDLGGFSSPTTAGYVIRTTYNNWGLRFGAFSSDHEVMRKYHKKNDNEIFKVPSLIYDLDFYQFGINTGKQKKEGFRAEEFDMQIWIKEAYNSAIELAKKHSRSLAS